MEIPSPYTPESRATRNFYKLGGGQFHALKLYLRDMKTSMMNQRGLLQKNHEEELTRYPDMWQMIDEVYNCYYRNFDKQFHAILMNSAFVAAFSLFETMFKKVCIFSASKYSISPRIEFRNRIIDQCNNYITKQ